MTVEVAQRQERAHQQIAPLDGSAGHSVETSRRWCPGALERRGRPGHIDPGADDDRAVRGCFGQDAGDLLVAGRAVGGRAVADDEVVRPLELDRDSCNIPRRLDKRQRHRRDG